MKKVVMASGNKGKLAEMQTLLEEYGFEVYPQKYFFYTEADETGFSFVENAIIKARFAAKKTGFAAIADDSGLSVPYLNGRPGIYSARFAGKNATDALNNQKLLDVLKNAQGDQRSACYYCAVVFVNDHLDPTPKIGLGCWCGKVLEQPRGAGGFGYDSIMWMDETQCSVAELDPKQKSVRSHRAQALQSLLNQFD